MLVIGLIGGVASGKSFVATCFRELGAALLNADQIGHRVLEEVEVVQAIAQNWPEALDAVDQVNRTELAKIVFRSPGHQQNRKKLEQITHPRIGQRIDVELERLRSQGCLAAVLDAPVLLEAGWVSKCDKIVFVEAPLILREQRAIERGWALDELNRREQAQLPLSEKLAMATDVIHNDAAPELTRAQVKRLWKSWGLASVECSLPLA